uniref:Kinesin motor domain-containing protein n=1 Tax=Chromera velia CCMP2878 TaxID=1169474 RepID=A0A0K6S727_9ALVE|eukprot:Cvel_3583.t1-p1 / transcript=Cvel_3583.t1 / gene=Cvel_3583 / organism=Chromera_velia_CCMP2878 / gene_product=hypothetical protein / transcript_product=hypothetical protein / location=Cvel_scaffold146:95071-99112(+) / protein_length=631 / sequence_SO=supercontig / SO=protein_coding / is_pseudo=false
MSVTGDKDAAAPSQAFDQHNTAEGMQTRSAVVVVRVRPPEFSNLEPELSCLKDLSTNLSRSEIELKIPADEKNGSMEEEKSYYTTFDHVLGLGDHTADDREKTKLDSQDSLWETIGKKTLEHRKGKQEESDAWARLCMLEVDKEKDEAFDLLAQEKAERQSRLTDRSRRLAPRKFCPKIVATEEGLETRALHDGTTLKQWIYEGLARRRNKGNHLIIKVILFKTLGKVLDSECRQTELAKLLRASFRDEDNCILKMIATVRPEEVYARENRWTLDLAARFKKITKAVYPNEVSTMYKRHLIRWEGERQKKASDRQKQLAGHDEDTHPQTLRLPSAILSRSQVASLEGKDVGAVRHRPSLQDQEEEDGWRTPEPAERLNKYLSENLDEEGVFRLYAEERGRVVTYTLKGDSYTLGSQRNHPKRLLPDEENGGNTEGSQKSSASPTDFPVPEGSTFFSRPFTEEIRKKGWLEAYDKVLDVCEDYRRAGLEGVRPGTIVVLCDATVFLKEEKQRTDDGRRVCRWGTGHVNRVFSRPYDLKTDQGRREFRDTMTYDKALVVDGTSATFVASHFHLNSSGNTSNQGGGAGRSAAAETAANAECVTVKVSRDGEMSVFFSHKGQRYKGNCAPPQVGA